MRIMLNDQDLAVVRQWYESAKKRRGKIVGKHLAAQLGFEKTADVKSAAAG